MKNATVFYRGPSLLTGEPILAGLTGLSSPSKNSKTGPMVQAYILRSDKDPMAAVKDGSDSAICGDCKHRSGSNVGRSCYVVWWYAPNNAFRSFLGMPIESVQNIGDRLEGHQLRIASYGDPAAVPIELWQSLLRKVSGWTGYTHHWKTCDVGFKDFLMASVDTESERQEASDKGWRTFRVRLASETLCDEVICPASDEGHHATTCHDCNLCRGTSRQAKSVAIIVHGQRTAWFRSGAQA